MGAVCSRPPAEGQPRRRPACRGGCLPWKARQPIQVKPGHPHVEAQPVSAPPAPPASAAALHNGGGGSTGMGAAAEHGLPGPGLDAFGSPMTSTTALPGLHAQAAEADATWRSAAAGSNGSAAGAAGAACPAPDRRAGAGEGRAAEAAHEVARLAEVQQSLSVVKGGHKGLDSITQLVAQLYRVPLAAINLIAEHRLEFASVAGPLKEAWGTGTDRAGTFCEALLLPQVHTLLCIPDTTQDYRFRCLACVSQDPHIRFYCGTPLVSSRGHRLGSLCVFDLTPRTLSTDALNLLASLAEMAARLLEESQVEELEKEQRARRKAAAAALQREPRVVRAAVLLCDASSRRWPILWANAGAAALSGLPQKVLRNSGFFEVFVPDHGPSTPPELQAAVDKQQAVKARISLPGAGRHAEVQFSPASLQQLEGEESHPLIDVSAALRATGAPAGAADMATDLMWAAIEA